MRLDIRNIIIIIKSHEDDTKAVKPGISTQKGRKYAKDFRGSPYMHGGMGGLRG
jgi:hypothetical protein